MVLMESIQKILDEELSRMEVGDEVKHPERVKDISVFKMKVEKTFEYWIWGFGVYSILGNTWSSWIGTRNEVRSSFQCLDIIYDDMFQVLITSLNQSLLVEKKFRKPHDRQIFEGVLIAQNERRDHWWIPTHSYMPQQCPMWGWRERLKFDN